MFSRIAVEQFKASDRKDREEWTIEEGEGIGVLVLVMWNDWGYRISVLLLLLLYITWINNFHSSKDRFTNDYQREKWVIKRKKGFKRLTTYRKR